MLLSCLLQNCTGEEEKEQHYNGSDDEIVENGNAPNSSTRLSEQNQGDNMNESLSSSVVLQSLRMSADRGDGVSTSNLASSLGQSALEAAGIEDSQQEQLQENNGSLPMNLSAISAANSMDGEQQQNSSLSSSSISIWQRIMGNFNSKENDSMRRPSSRLLAKQAEAIDMSGNHSRNYADTTTLYIKPKSKTCDIHHSASPLKQADSFTSAKICKIPSIKLDEFVMPGSDLQKAMSEAVRKMSTSTEETYNEFDGVALGVDDSEDECVICMEGFSDDNPRMPTLCACGENKTYFHLPCLLLWTDKNVNCPTCDTKITWEEF